MLRHRGNRKGFTLVEVIVVLVILAILAAIMIPALTGYIEKASKKTAIAEARSILLATQTAASEHYNDADRGVQGSQDGYEMLSTAAGNEAAELAGITQTYFYPVLVTGKNQVVYFRYTTPDGHYAVEYNANATNKFTVEKLNS